VKQPTNNESRYKGNEYILTSVNRGVKLKHLNFFDHETLMYSQPSMAREPGTNHYKPLGTHMTLGLVSRIDEFNLIEGDLLKGEN
jgi:hypothetical protein